MKSLLIVDDQPGIRLLLEELFRQEGYETRGAANGMEALQKIDQKRPDCILLDMKMPGMDGIEVLRKIKANWPHVPVMMMTAFGEVELTAEALEIGAHKYFTKPFDVHEVREAVNDLFAC